MVSPASSPVKYAIIVAAVLGIITLVYLAGHKAGSDGTQARWDNAEAKHALARAQQLTARRATERRLQDELQTVTDTLTEQQMAVADELHRTIADIGSDNLRLRERFKGCSSGVPETANATEGHDVTARGGLSPADETLLVRIAARADGYARQLIACQAYVDLVQ